MITNAASGTDLHEIAPGIYRINTPVRIPGGPGFNFGQYLVAGDEPLLFHTGPKQMFPLVAEAIGKVLPPERLRKGVPRGSARSPCARCSAIPSAGSRPRRRSPIRSKRSRSPKGSRRLPRPSPSSSGVCFPSSPPKMSRPPS